MQWPLAAGARNFSRVELPRDTESRACWRRIRCPITHNSDRSDLPRVESSGGSLRNAKTFARPSSLLLPVVRQTRTTVGSWWKNRMNRRVGGCFDFSNIENACKCATSVACFAFRKNYEKTWDLDRKMFRVSISRYDSCVREMWCNIIWYISKNYDKNSKVYHGYIVDIYRPIIYTSFLIPNNSG